MTRRGWWVFGAASLVLLLVVTGALTLRPTPDETEAPSATLSAASSPAPWESPYLSGYDPTPGPLELTPLEDATGETFTVSLALEPNAITHGGNIGLSFDATELANPIWNSDESNLTLTLQELDRPALRFGGNGVDRRMWWTSVDEPAPDWAEATVTPEDLRRVAAVAEDVDAQVTIALDLGHDDPERAADMAAHAQQAFGDRLIAVAIGNEPNGYFHPNQPQLAVRDESWDPEKYQQSLQKYAAALEEAAPGVPIAGPGAYDAPWWRAFAESGIHNQRALTLHWYPLWDCEGPASSIANPTVDDLTSPALREQARHIVGMGADVAMEHRLPLWIEETGPTSCPGTNDTSRTHAQALWTVDYVMTAAELGVERTAFHSTLQACDGGAPMSPLCATGEHWDPGEVVAGRTSFLALMLLSHVPDGSILTPAVSGDGTVMAHGVLADDGGLTVVLVDFRDPARDSSAASVQISAPSGLPSNAAQSWELVEGSRLSGTALNASSSALTATTDISGSPTTTRLQRAAPISLTSDAGTATVLHFAPVTGPEQAG